MIPVRHGTNHTETGEGQRRAVRDEGVETLREVLVRVPESDSPTRMFSHFLVDAAGLGPSRAIVPCDGVLRLGHVIRE